MKQDEKQAITTETKQKLVSIIMLSHNVGEVTRMCVESIQRNVTISYEILVIDNGSDQKTLEILKALQGIRLIQNEENKGFPAGCNQGMKEAGGELLWFLNNDTIVTPGALERMVELLVSDEKNGIVGPVTNAISGKQEIPVDYPFERGKVTTDWQMIDAFAKKWCEAHAGETQRMIRLIGFSMLMRRRDLKKMGGFDERMGIGTFEDDSLSLRFVSGGYRLLIARDAFIHHVSSASFLAAGGYPTGGVENQITASKTAGMTVPDEVVFNDKLMKHLKAGVTRILHVECGGGALGLWAEENGIYAEALESDVRKATVAKNHYPKLTQYLPGEVFSYDTSEIEAVIAEKQYDSEQTLILMKSLAENMKEGTQVLIQVPKITAINGCCMLACAEYWEEEGYRPLRGNFDQLRFLEGMAELGLELKNYFRVEPKRGFFKSNAFRRQKEAYEKEAVLQKREEQKGKLDFFKEDTYVFEKYAKN